MVSRLLTFLVKISLYCYLTNSWHSWFTAGPSHLFLKCCSCCWVLSCFVSHLKNKKNNNFCREYSCTPYALLCLLHSPYSWINCICDNKRSNTEMHRHKSPHLFRDALHSCCQESWWIFPHLCQIFLHQQHTSPAISEHAVMFTWEKL